VPAGNSAIIKGAVFYNVGAGSDVVIANFYSRDNSVNVRFVSQSLATFVSLVWSGWQVLNNGDAVVVQAFTMPMNYWISGALLPYTAGQVAPAVESADVPLPIDQPFAPVIYLPEQATHIAV